DPRESAGEALTIADAKGEAWMFHILPDDSGASAVWVAQRVPDTHITVVANEFMIHQVNLADTDNFMGSTNMHEIAERNGSRSFAQLNQRSPGVGSNRNGGHFERAISIYDATYTFVTSIHPTNVNLGFLWFGPYAPHATIYVPIFVRTADVPAEVGRGSLRQFNSSSLFWANLAVGNYASLWYKFTRPVMADTQRRVEDVAGALRCCATHAAIHAMVCSHAVDTELAVVYDEAQAALAKEGDVGVTSVLTRASNKFASTGLAAATALFQDLVTRFHNGSVVIKSTEHSFSVQYMGYPTWWLDSVGYYNSTQAGLDDSPCNVYVSGGIIAAFCVLVVGAMAAGFILGQRASIKLKRGYAFIQ
ncbi:hypothetical protein DYB32_010766, partial [Aphanomyces invadans]